MTLPSPTSLGVRPLAAAVIAIGLAVAGPAQAPAKTADHTRSACFVASQADGFSAAGDKAVNIRVGVRDVYQMTLFAPCIDLDWSQHIAIRSHGSSWICEGNGLDYEIVTPSPIGHQRCQVTTVRKLTPEEVAALPAKQRP